MQTQKTCRLSCTHSTNFSSAVILDEDIGSVLTTEKLMLHHYSLLMIVQLIGTW